MSDLAAITAAQTDIQQKQHAIGRLQHLATHRPRLRIRHVSLVEGSHIDDPEFNPGAEVKGGIVVVNVGGSDATIVDSRYRIFFSKTGLPVEAPYDRQFRSNLLLKNQVLIAGESCAAPIFDTIAPDFPAVDTTTQPDGGKCIA